MLDSNRVVQSNVGADVEARKYGISRTNEYRFAGIGFTQNTVFSRIIGYV
jgi:hypothetical protein